MGPQRTWLLWSGTEVHRSEKEKKREKRETKRENTKRTQGPDYPGLRGHTPEEKIKELINSP